MTIKDIPYEEAAANLRAASDVELALTLKVFSRAYERVYGERRAAAEVAAERLMALPKRTAPEHEL